MNLQGITLGFAVTGSFCTMNGALEEAQNLISLGASLVPIMSEHAAGTDTRFGSSEYFKGRLSEICAKPVIDDIKSAEPIGPKKLLDALLIMPCTGNTMAKIANGISDTAVSLSAKSHMRNGRPVILAIASNDALGANAKNLGLLLNTKNIYFVPFSQDDPITKTTSLISHFDLAAETVSAALGGSQLQPLLR